MSGRLRYPKAARVRRKSEYTRAFADGVAVRDALLKLVVVRRKGPPAGAPGRGAIAGAAPADLTIARLGTAVSRKVGGAVRRNRVRRRLREAFRLVRGTLPPGLDLVAVPLHSTAEPTFEALERSLVALARKAAAKLEARERG